MKMAASAVSQLCGSAKPMPAAPSLISTLAGTAWGPRNWMVKRTWGMDSMAMISATLPSGVPSGMFSIFSRMGHSGGIVSDLRAVM